MSAAPQIRPPRQPHTAAPPKPKLAVRPRGYHHERTRTDVIDRMYRSRWNFEALSADVFRVTSGTAQPAILTRIHFHSEGAANPRERGKWTPVLLPDDLAKEVGLSAQEMRIALAAMLERKLVIRKGETGRDAFRYQLDYQAIRAAKNAFERRDKLGEQKENSADSTDTSTESRAIGIARGKCRKVATIPASETAIAIKFRNKSDIALAMTSTLSHGELTIEAVRSLEVSPAPNPTPAKEPEPPPPPVPTPFDLAGPGLFRPHADAGEIQQGLARLQPPIYLDGEYAAQTARALVCPVPFFLRCAADRIKQAVGRRQPVTSSLVQWIVKNANAQWEIAGPVQRAREQGLTPADLAETERRQAEMFLAQPLDNPDVTDADRAWARGILGKDGPA